MKRPFVLTTTFLGLAVLTFFFQNCGSNNTYSSAIPSVDQNRVPICRKVESAAVAPKLKWDWIQELQNSPDKSFPTFDQVMSSPMVADLDGDGIPEVVFITFSKHATDWFSDALGPNHYRNGVLRIVDGATGKTKKSIGSMELAPHGSHSPLLVDIDGDGKVEILYIHYLSSGNRTIIALNHDGSLRWKYTLPFAFNFTSGFTASDVNHDGIAEIHVGPLVLTENFSKQPFVLFHLAGATASGGTTISVALDPSKPQDVSLINSSGVYNRFGTQTFAFPKPANYTSVADIFPEKKGLEIISTGDGHLTIYSGLTGEVLSTKDLSQYNDLKCASNRIGGGPSSVGDFDGDPSTLEIAVATGRYLTIFDRNSNPIYQSESQDCSSLSTGLTSFDLNGDKKPEILYSDEEYFRIYEVENGELKIRHQIVNPSGTLVEYPLVVDVDGNGTAELILASNNYASAGFYRDPHEVADQAEGLEVTGVRAFESAQADAWMPTRPIWNQYSFHPDQFNNRAQWMNNAKVDGSIFRRNNQGYNSNLVCK